MIFLILLTLFISIPIIEIMVLIDVGSAIGLPRTILFVIFTAVLGAFLVKQQGVATLMKVQEQFQAGQTPALEVAQGFLLLVAGAVLLTPGFVTDAIGFILLIPWVRKRLVLKFMQRGFSTTFTTNHTQTNESMNRTKTVNQESGSVIDAEHWSSEEDTEKNS